MVADLTTGNVGLGPDMSTHPVGSRGSLMVVSDGMGGAVAGEIASEMAVTSIRESLMEMPTDLTISDQLKMATEIANERIWEHAQQNPELSGMGATVTAVLVQGTSAYIGQVGDSRAYLIRGERIKQLTKDQSLAQMLVDSGAITPEQIHSVPQNVIMQALGTQPTVKVALTAVELCRNDHLLICSDGLSNKFQDNIDELRQTAQSSADLTAACRRLVEIANERGGEDNITVIIARFDGEALHSATDSSSITGSFKAINQEYYGDRSQADHHTSVTSQLASPIPPANPDKETTTLVMAALPSSVSFESEEAAPDEEEISTLSQPPVDKPAAEPSADEPLAASATAAASPATESRTVAVVRKKRKRYTGALILGLLSVLLILGAIYFYYIKVWKPQHRQAPAAVQQEGGTASDQPTPAQQRPAEQRPAEQRPAEQAAPQGQRAEESRSPGGDQPTPPNGNPNGNR
jgi:protein phosphatase